MHSHYGELELEATTTLGVNEITELADNVLPNPTGLWHEHDEFFVKAMAADDGNLPVYKQQLLAQHFRAACATKH